MLIRESMSVFWQTLRDTWEELYALAIVNLVWLFSWSLPIGLGALTKIPAVIMGTALVSLMALPIATAGMYWVTGRVAHGKTFHFHDFIDGIKLLWWRALLWMLINIIFVGLCVLNLWFYPTNFAGTWVILVGGLWLAVLAFWLGMQIYFWPLMVAQEEYKLLRAWRNAAYLILANPFYAFFTASFTVVLLALSVATTLPFIFIGMALPAILGNNAALTLLHKFGIIEDPRPKPLG